MSVIPRTAATAGASDGTDVAPNPYDRVPYSLSCFPQTHPDRLATVATLFGMKPAPPDRCRVLELGCARGGNLIPMALTVPHSRLVGIDLSRRQIEDGRAMVRELGLANVELRELSILDVDDSLGTFDYVICHGVYSWVPPEVQRKILDVCRRNLAPQGVAYVSYNTLPGWHARGAIREMLLYHTERFDEPAERVREARALLGFLAGAVKGDAAYASLVGTELAVLTGTPDSYLLHEHLEEHNEPLYFHEFARRAAERGLQYLGEAHFATMVASKLGAGVEKVLRQISTDLLHMEQYMDFVRNRMFRQTLLCHAGVALDGALRAEAVERFYVASPAKPVPLAAGEPTGAAPGAEPAGAADDAEQFRAGEDLSLVTRDAVMKAAMRLLGARWPQSVQFPELLAEAGRVAGVAAPAGDDAGHRLATRLLNCYASGLVELSLLPPAFTLVVSDRPVASPYARLLARAESTVSNMRLDRVPLGEGLRALLVRLDGRHGRDELAGTVAAMLAARQPAATHPPADGPAGPADTEPPTDADRALRFVDEVLDGFARSALLIA